MEKNEQRDLPSPFQRGSAEPKKAFFIERRGGLQSDGKRFSSVVNAR